jgi:hypothetical protein
MKSNATYTGWEIYKCNNWDSIVKWSKIKKKKKIRSIKIKTIQFICSTGKLNSKCSKSPTFHLILIQMLINFTVLLKKPFLTDCLLEIVILKQKLDLLK